MTEQRLALVEEQDSREFLQRRVSQFGLNAGVLGLVALPLHMPWKLTSSQSALWVDRSLVPHILAALVLLGVGLLNRGKPRSKRFIQTTETVGMVSSCALYCWMGSFIPVSGDYILLLAMSFSVFARAVLVPSSAQRTLALTAACGLAFAIAVYSGNSPDPNCPPASLRLMHCWMWWALSTAQATGTSYVIYGLREQVRAAQQVGQYVLDEKIGEGAMGVVYRARHAMLRRPTAVKLLRPELAGGVALARFEREVQLTATLSHPNTITVFDYGRTPDGTFYYAMELLEGANLEDIVSSSGPLPPERVVHILRQVASALVEAHAAGLVHRDIKPANIFLCAHAGIPDLVKVLDFGIVRQLHEPAGTLGDRRGIGTPHYISPEGISSPELVSPRSDLYALGAVGYFLLTGRPLFDATTPIEVWTHHLHSVPVPIAERIDTPVPRALETLLFCCLSKSPDDRPSSAREVIVALDRIDLPRWDDATVERWWQVHRPRLLERQSTSATRRSPAMTLSIDIAARREA